ncbi:MAG: hypothetical protein ACK2VD_13065, partial [Anaerolineae bacterium]
MSINVATPWHKRSYERFLQEQLPELLSDRLPLVSYAALPSGTHRCEIHLALASGHNGEVELTYSIPQPDEEGTFDLEGEPYVVVPTASDEALDEAEIRCAGEQLYAYVEARLGQAPADLTWDAALARAWLPLDTWVDAFLGETAQRLDTTNWVSRHTHLRRLLVLQHEHVIASGQIGLVCPFESPEGPNMGRVFTVALGAEIRDGRLVAVDDRPVVRDRPEAQLGISASLIPLIEHDDPNRILMGANMIRQAIVPPNPEPALVQTGNEPDVPGFWTGRNLLTAFISWGADTTADGIVISESCAGRLDYPYPAEPGDKLANRHGTKGVVSRVLPDDEMPHLPDGTPVELIYNFSGLHVRLNYGQEREALLGRIARAEGEPVIAPPFEAPSEDELHERLAAAALPASGMETLTLGVGGPTLARPSLVGWVYWNRLAHLAEPKLHAAAEGGRQLQGVLECQALLEVGAYENLRETLNTRAARRPDAGTLVARIEAGPVVQAGPPTPMFAELVRRLRVAGIEAALEGDQVAFRFAPQKDGALQLARPVPHPWLRERELDAIGPSGAVEADERHVAGIVYPQDRSGSGALSAARARLVEANERLARMLDSRAPERLVEGAAAGLEARVRAFFDLLLTPQQLRFFERQLFSGRAVLAPGSGLQLDQVGLPEEMAWALFGPLVVQELGSEDAAAARDEDAARALDAVMARSWVIVHRAPVLSPTALLAFHPRRGPGPAIRLHPLACKLLDADFDGDQAAIYLPLTEGAQAEAGEKLSVAGHLARDPSLVEALLPPPEALWGLASLGLDEGGLDEIAALAGGEVGAPNGAINERTLGEAMRALLRREGVDALLTAAQRLMARGFEAVRASGASMSPFLGEGLALPSQPGTEEVEAWRAYVEELTAMLLSRADYQDLNLGPQLLAIQTRERGRSQLVALLGPKILTDLEGRPVIARHSSVEGVTAEELYTWIVGARRGLAQVWQRWETL